jgi:hypothetical protein
MAIGFALFGTLLPLTNVLAQDSARDKPIAVVSIASYDRLMADLTYLTTTSGRPEVGGLAQFLTEPFTRHMNTEQPAGILFTVADGEAKGVGFLPIPNLEELLDVVTERFGADVEELDDGIKRVRLDQNVYVKQQGPWVFFTDAIGNLQKLPSDPASHLDGLEKKYDAALRLKVQNIPQEIRDAALKQVKAGLEMQLDPALGGERELNQDLARQLQKNWLESVTMLIHETDELTVGWAVDSAGQRTFVDVTMTAVDGSKFARQMKILAEAKSSFTGFLLPQSAASFQASSKISSRDVEQTLALMKFLRQEALKGIDKDPNAPSQLKDIVNEVLDVVDQTIENGQMDLGATVVLGPRSWKFVGGGYVADGQALAQAFQRVIDLARNEPDVPEVQFNADEHRGVSFHKLTVPIPDDDRDTRKVLGEKLDVVIGTGQNCLYVALGTDSDQLLKTVLDGSAERPAQSVPPAQLRVAVKPLIRFLASVDDDENLERLAETLDEVTGGDELRVSVTAITNGIQYRLEVQEGVLQVLGKAAATQQQQQ